MSETETSSETDAEPETSNDAFGLTGIVPRPLERALVRRRESSVTTAAWRLDLTCDQGEGGIVRVEVSTDSGERAVYRGDGVFLGWSQERLAEVYDTLTRPTGGDPEFVLLQLG